MMRKQIFKKCLYTERLLKKINEVNESIKKKKKMPQYAFAYKDKKTIPVENLYKAIKWLRGYHQYQYYFAHEFYIYALDIAWIVLHFCQEEIVVLSILLKNFNPNREVNAKTLSLYFGNDIIEKIKEFNQHPFELKEKECIIDASLQYLEDIPNIDVFIVNIAEWLYFKEKGTALNSLWLLRKIVALLKRILLSGMVIQNVDPDTELMYKKKRIIDDEDDFFFSGSHM